VPSDMKQSAKSIELVFVQEGDDNREAVLLHGSHLVLTWSIGESGEFIICTK